MPKLAKILSQVEKANEARKARALEQGFDVYEKVYHGTGSAENLTAFDPKLTGQGADQFGSGFYLTSQPEEASGYAMDNYRGQGSFEADSQAVLPLVSRGDLIDVDGSEVRHTGDVLNLDYEQTREMLDEASSLKRGVDDEDMNPLGDYYDSFWDGGPEDWMLDDLAQNMAGRNPDELADIFDNQEEYLKALSKVTGKDGIRVHFDDRFHEIHWKPENIRSVNAAFNPENINKSDLMGNADLAPLAGMAATGTAAAATPIAYNQAQSIDRNQGIDEQRQASYAKQKQFFDNFSARRLARKAAKTAIGTGEAALTIGSGLANESAAGLAGLYGAATGQNPADIIQHFQENPSLYLPQTEEGMAQLEGLQGLIDDTVKYWGPRGGTQAIQNFKQSQDYLNTQGAKIDPSLGAGMATALGLLPEVL